MAYRFPGSNTPKQSSTITIPQVPPALPAKKHIHLQVSQVSTTVTRCHWQFDLSCRFTNLFGRMVSWVATSSSRWWFHFFYSFIPIWGRFPVWPIFFRWVETTNQLTIFCFFSSLNFFSFFLLKSVKDVNFILVRKHLFFMNNSG